MNEEVDVKALDELIEILNDHNTKQVLDDQEWQIWEYLYNKNKL